MRVLKMRALAWITAAAFVVTCAHSALSQSEYGNATAQAGQASASASQAASVSAELSKKVDSKDAKVGDEVVAKTTAEARFSDGTKIPKGSRLVGHVTDVQAKTHDNHDAHIAFAFDHAVLKDGRDVPIHAMVRSISVPAPVTAPAGNDDMMAGGGGGGGARGGGGGGGVGMAGGASNTVRATGLGAGATSATGGLSNAASGVDGAANGAAGAAGGLAANGPALNNPATANAGLAAGPVMPVGNLSGVTFATVRAAGDASTSGVNGSAGASTATMLIGHGRNVSLDSGSQMNLAVATQ